MGNLSAWNRDKRLFVLQALSPTSWNKIFIYLKTGELVLYLKGVLIEVAPLSTCLSLRAEEPNFSTRNLATNENSVVDTDPKNCYLQEAEARKALVTHGGWSCPIQLQVMWKKKFLCNRHSTSLSDREYLPTHSRWGFPASNGKWRRNTENCIGHRLDQKGDDFKLIKNDKRDKSMKIW